MTLVEMVQFMWKRETIPADLVWTILILTPMVNADTLGIVILGVLLKVMEAIIYSRIKKSVTFHDVFHGFHMGGGMGTAII